MPFLGEEKEEEQQQLYQRLVINNLKGTTVRICCCQWFATNSIHPRIYPESYTVHTQTNKRTERIVLPPSLSQVAKPMIELQNDVTNSELIGLFLAAVVLLL